MEGHDNIMSLIEQVDLGRQVLDDLIWTVLSDYASLLLDKGCDREVLRAAAEQTLRKMGMELTIRKSPYKRGVKKYKDIDNVDQRRKHTDISNKARAGRATSKRLADEDMDSKDEGSDVPTTPETLEAVTDGDDDNDGNDNDNDGDDSNGGMDY